jgi:hypothetical protein
MLQKVQVNAGLRSKQQIEYGPTAIMEEINKGLRGVSERERVKGQTLKLLKRDLEELNYKLAAFSPQKIGTFERAKELLRIEDKLKHEVARGEGRADSYGEGMSQVGFFGKIALNHTN